jgi:hypothetical protein
MIKDPEARKLLYKRIQQLRTEGWTRSELMAEFDMSLDRIKYALSPQKGMAKVRRHQRFLKETLIQDAGGVCVDCGGTYPPFVMDFDHRDPSQKDFEISSARHRSASLSSLRAEANKCDLVCSNCHRMRTHKQRCDGCRYCSTPARSTKGNHDERQRTSLPSASRLGNCCYPDPDWRHLTRNHNGQYPNAQLRPAYRDIH